MSGNSKPPSFNPLLNPAIPQDCGNLRAYEQPNSQELKEWWNLCKEIYIYNIGCDHVWPHQYQSTGIITFFSGGFGSEKKPVFATGTRGATPNVYTVIVKKDAKPVPDAGIPYVWYMYVYIYIFLTLYISMWSTMKAMWAMKPCENSKNLPRNTLLLRSLFSDSVA